MNHTNYKSLAAALFEIRIKDLISFIRESKYKLVSGEIILVRAKVRAQLQDLKTEYLVFRKEDVDNQHMKNCNAKLLRKLYTVSIQINSLLVTNPSNRKTIFEIEALLVKCAQI